jgi:antitoxin component of MazEF toxin-antitoxin module
LVKPAAERKQLRYTAAELLADYDATTPLMAEEREWLDAPRVGRELL